MSAKRSALILHVMEDRLRLLAGQASSWNFELSEMADIPLEVRVEEGGKDLASILFKEIERISLRRNLKNPLVVVAVSRALLVWRYFKVPPVPVENLEGLVGFEIEKHLPVNPGEVYYRHLPVDRTEEGWTILLAGTRRDFIARVEEALRMIGFKPLAVIPDLWGLIYLLRKRGEELESGNPVIVHLELKTAEVAVLKEGLPVFYRRYSLPEEAGASTSQAEQVAGDARSAAGVIENALREASEAAGVGTAMERGWLCVEGYGSDVLLQRLESSAVRDWKVIRSADLPLARQALGTDGHPRLLVSAGLALGAAHASSGPVNLLPLPPARRPRKANLKITAALALILALSSAFYLASADAGRRRELEMLEEAVVQQKGKVEAVKTLMDDLKKEEARTRTLEGLVRRRTMVVDILKELSAVIPSTAYLSQFTIKSGNVELLGYADSASDLIPRLEASPLFKNVAFDAPITSLGQQKERFKIKMTLE